MQAFLLPWPCLMGPIIWCYPLVRPKYPQQITSSWYLRDMERPCLPYGSFSWTLLTGCETEDVWCAIFLQSATLFCLYVVISFRGIPWEGLGYQAPMTTTTWKKQMPGVKSTLLGVTSGSMPQTWCTHWPMVGQGDEDSISTLKVIKPNAHIVYSKKENSRCYSLNPLPCRISQKNSIVTNINIIYKNYKK